MVTEIYHLILTYSEGGSYIRCKQSEPLHRACYDIETRLRSLLVDIPIDNVPRTRSPAQIIPL